MSSRSIGLSPDLHEYLVRTTVCETDVMARLRAETAELPNAGMQISPEQGQFMRLLVELLDGRQAVEVGTFTGYSALCIAMALPADGRLIACDVSEETSRVARRYWQEAGVTDRIELRLGPALETLDALLAGGAAGTLDFAFIDADKANYGNYYERCLRLLRPGGVVAVDNALWGGRVADPSVDDEDTRAIRALNQALRADDRVTGCLLPVGDGLLLARKRWEAPSRPGSADPPAFLKPS